MSVKKPESEIITHKTNALKSFEIYIDGLIAQDENGQKKAGLLCYWIDDYIRFLKKEITFNPKKSRKYKRGDIVKVHLGYRIGSEEGGLHYCVVLDKDNPLSSPVLTVVPLTSVKNASSVNELPSDNVYLGNELYNLVFVKINTLLKTTEAMVNELSQNIGTFASNEVNEAKKRVDQLNKFVNEITKMKKGSIALTNQIVTISKIRIYDPKSDDDILSGIKLSNTNLDKIDEKILCNYTNSKQ